MIFKKIFTLTSLLIFLRPHLDFASSIISTYLGDIIILIIMLLSIIFCRFRIYREQSKLLIISMWLMLMLLIPTIVNFFRADSSIEVLFDYGKVVYFLLSFWFLYYILRNIPDKINIVNKLIDKTFMLIFFVAIIQLLNPPLLGELIKKTYGSAKLRDIWSGYPRVFSTFFNANWFGVYLVFYLSWLNSKLMFKMISYKNYILRAVMLSTLFIISGSRTGVVGAIIALFLQIVIYNNIKNLLIIITLSICLFFIGKSTILLSLVSKTLGRFTSFFKTLKTEGFNISKLDPGRAQSWQITLEKVNESPFFGSGNVGSLIPHNSYLYYLNAFGIMGVVVITAFLLMFMYFFRGKYSNVIEYDFTKKWRSSFIPAFLIMSLAGEFMFTTQVMFLVIYIFALEFSIKNFNA